jgi:hypothetical protein
MAKSVPQVSNEFGITFVPEEDVPEAPRQNDRNPALWKAILIILRQNPGQWAQVREFDKAGAAGAHASQINNGKKKAFPSKEWEARYTKSDNSSVLFMRYIGEKMTREQAEQASDVNPEEDSA